MMMFSGFNKMNRDISNGSLYDFMPDTLVTNYKTSRFMPVRYTCTLA